MRYSVSNYHSEQSPEQVNHPAGISPLIVIPSYDFEEIVSYHHRAAAVKDRAMAVSDDV